MKRRYGTPLPPTWFMQRPGFRRFMAREVTSVFVGGYVVFLLFWLARLGQGPEAFTAMVQTTRHPNSMVLHTVVVAAAAYHSITWFNLTPQITPLFIGEDRLPDAIAAIVMGYAPWVGVSGVVLWGLLR